MDNNKMPRFKIYAIKIITIFLLLFAALAPTRGYAAEKSVLLKEVVLSRHGVRSPTQPAAKLAEWSAKPWPRWPVRAGHLTTRGSSLISRQWTAERARLESLGVTPDKIFICADVDQRTKATADAISEALAPQGGITPVLSARAFVYPIFHPAEAGFADFDTDAVRRDIMKNAGGSLTALQQELAPKISMLADITGPLSERAAAKAGLLYGSTFADLPSEIEFRDGDRSVGITGALGAASGIVEIFLLEYCQWPEKNAGWGAADVMILRDLLPVHSRIFDAVNRAPSVARTRAGELTMLLASSLLSEELCLAKVPDAVKEPAAAAKAAIFVGHDTNIAGVGALIGADWQLPGFAKNEVPPGGALVLSLRQRGKERYVTAEFTGLSLEALHSDADRPVPADRYQISLSHMQRKPGTRPAGECSPEEFADWVNNRVANAR